MIHNKKLLVLGVDGMDPRLANHFREKGVMPNLDKLVKLGSAREDLRMLGGLPTITPPMWTSLATGATPATHGITCFWGQSKDDLSTMVYNLNSKRCKAEQLWNVTVEAGMKTLVWHWPGSSWPPTSDNPDLHVVDGTQPNAIGNGDCVVDEDKIIYASTDVESVVYKAKVPNTSGAGCVISDVPIEDENKLHSESEYQNASEMKNLIFSEKEGDMAADMLPVDIVNSPISEPTKWTFDIPKGAKEFTILINNGIAKRPALILMDENGKYTKVAVYKNKKTEEPMAVMGDEMVLNVMDELVKDDEKVLTNRHMRVLELAEDGSKVRMWLGTAKDVNKDVLWHPARLKKSVLEHVGPVPGTSMCESRNESLVKSVLLPCWDVYCKWQADSMNLLIKEEQYDAVFSHLHNVDACGHLFWYLSKDRPEIGNHGKLYEEAMEWTYRCTDRYIGEFLHYIDEGWTIMLISDHGLLANREDEIPLLGDGFGCNVRVMEEMGYTVLKKDENGNELREIDYSKTKAVANRGNFIRLNLKGRDPHGIIDPKDKYDVETKLIDDLYAYRNKDGKRIVSIAMRNKEAELLGLDGEESGDVVYWLEEGFNRLHGDSLSTYHGLNHTSVSPIFVAAGKGIKKDFVTDRVVRTFDVAPTLALIADIRMPKQCEGAPVYQILED